MGQVRLDCVWLDGYEPTVNLRTKAQIIDSDVFTGDLRSVPEWGFDGSSAKQAEGHYSDCILKPVRLYNDPFVADAYFVLCEVLNADRSVHISNTRALIEESASAEFWFGFDQEYRVRQCSFASLPDHESRCNRSTPWRERIGIQGSRVVLLLTSRVEGLEHIVHEM